MPSIAVTKKFSLSGYRDAIYKLIPASEKGAFFSAGGDGMIVKWNINTGTDGDLVARLPSAVYSLAFDQETNRLIGGCRFGHVYVLDLSTKTQLAQFTLPGDVFVLKLVEGLLIAACGNGHIYFIQFPSLSVMRHYQPTTRNARS